MAFSICRFPTAKRRRGDCGNRPNTNPYWGELEHYHNFSRDRLFALLDDSGFAVVDYDVSVRYYSCMEIIARKRTPLVALTHGAATMTTFSAFRIHADKTSHRAGVEEMKVDDLSPGEVVIKVAYSSVNYKDALAGSGKGKILRQSPLNGGIDVSGTVVSSTDPKFKEGDDVLCTGSGLSETHDGGYAQYARLESKWTIPLPKGLSLREAMVIGTAGFTAALSLYRMKQNGQVPDMGPIVVTGATGGVGQLAIDILTQAGYEAHAISGKIEHFDDLIALGAKQCISTQGFVLGSAPARIDESGPAPSTMSAATCCRVSRG